MAAAFEINDPVHVSTKEGRQLEGVVAFVGSVSFADGDDWVGVRLTGASVGLGKNDGTVKGTEYFSCPPNCGMFVRKSALSKRPLTRLEELRLRRELAGTGTAVKTTSSASATAPGAAMKATTTTTTTTPTREPSAASARTKLEELRARRAALAEKKEETVAAATPDSKSVPVKSPPVALSKPELQPQVDQLKSEVKEMANKLQKKQQDAASLQQKLSQAEQETHEARRKILELEAAIPSSPQKTPSPVKVSVVPDEIQQQLSHLENENLNLTDKLSSALAELTNLREELSQEKDSHNADLDTLTKARSETTALQKELQALSDKTMQRGVSDASHYKERAKLQAEISAAKRKAEHLEKEKLELESAVEEITLDKEQLQEEKEFLEDRLEEIRLDAETAQMEVEELRVELDDARASAERVTSLTESADSGDAEDMAQALSVQNARLREALIRLREQSSIEKMEVSKQLRAAEKDAEMGKALVNEVESLRVIKADLEEQINDLKDMVEQGAAFEGMVEDLSDRVLTLEEDNVALQSTIRELEESAELTAEMEEVQADELKALYRDLEGRDTIIRNLEEAIKMQRRREEDFRRTVGNYRTTVDTLKQEKQALLELQQGGEGEKNDLVASSQRALARAAQLVSDAAEMRKREAQAIVDRIDQQVFKHMSARLERLLPQSAVAREVSALRGEMLVSKVLAKASGSLEGISGSFSRRIKPALAEVDEADAASVASALHLSDELKQEVMVMFHETEFAHVMIDVSSDLLRIFAAGQWPDLLSPEASTELGSILGHSIGHLDSGIGTVLRTLKEEGILTPEQSNIDALKQIILTTIQGLRSDTEREEGTLVPPSWNPPGWQLLKNASFAKFTCMGATAALCLVLNQPGSFEPPSSLAELYNILEEGSTQSCNVCHRLAGLDVKNASMISNLSTIVETWKNESAILLKEIQALLLLDGDAISCKTAVQNTRRELAKVLSALRSANLNQTDDQSYHALSPEADDFWNCVSSIARSIRSVDGDEEDVNYLMRARLIEQRLNRAIENEPKLSLANTKVSSLEKSLASRSKEIAMQNARLSELEKLLAKTSTGTRSIGIASDMKSSEEFNSLKEENRVLTEAMDVLQRQVDEYENEIRSLKDFKSPAGKRGRTPRRAMTSISDLASPVGKALEDSQTGTGALEAALFRPALQSALREAAEWQASTIAREIEELPPLPAPSALSISRDGGISSDDKDDLVQLLSAISSYRLEKASIRMVDLTKIDKLPRLQLREQKQRKLAATRRLEAMASKCRRHAYP